MVCLETDAARARMFRVSRFAFRFPSQLSTVVRAVLYTTRVYISTVSNRAKKPSPETIPEEI